MKNNSKFFNKESHESPFIIAETAYNHEGDINYLYKMIDEIAEMGLNAVKFHLLLNLDSYMVQNHPLMDQMKNWIFNKNQWEKIIHYSIKKGLDVITLCDDVESLKYINKIHSKVKGVELHASCLNDYFLLNEAVNFPNMIVLGIGGSSIDEIQFAVDFLKMRGKDNILLMYGFQSFPTDYATINLSKMMKIHNLFDLPVGYADHTRYDDPNNEIVSIMGAMMGFNVLEKHFTLVERVKRIDFAAAVGKNKFKRINNLMELALRIYGNGGIHMSNEEKSYGNVGPMKKALVARKMIKKGEKIKLDDVWFKRTELESSLMQKQLFSVIGLKAKNDIVIDEIIDFSKVNFKFQKINGKILGLNQKK